MDVNFPEAVNRTPNPASEGGNEVFVVGNCYGFGIVPASEVKDYYRGYALVAVPAIAIAAAAGIAYLAFELLF